MIASGGTEVPAADHAIGHAAGVVNSSASKPQAGLVVLLDTHHAGEMQRVREASLRLGLGPTQVLIRPQPKELIAALRAAPQALVLMDAAWAAAQAESVLQPLRRESAGRLILLWADAHEESPRWPKPSQAAPDPTACAPPVGATERWLNLAVRWDARGAMNLPATPQELLARALRCVQDGQMWFSRVEMQQLYEAAVRRLAQAPSWQNTAGFGGNDDSTGAAPTSPLTPRERTVFQLMREGFSNKEIAARLDISLNTVKKHLAAVFTKTGLKHRRQILA